MYYNIYLAGVKGFYARYVMQKWVWGEWVGHTTLRIPADPATVYVPCGRVDGWMVGRVAGRYTGRIETQSEPSQPSLDGNWKAMLVQRGNFAAEVLLNPSLSLKRCSTLVGIRFGYFRRVVVD